MTATLSGLAIVCISSKLCSENLDLEFDFQFNAMRRAKNWRQDLLLESDTNRMENLCEQLAACRREKPKKDSAGDKKRATVIAGSGSNGAGEKGKRGGKITGKKGKRAAGSTGYTRPGSAQGAGKHSGNRLLQPNSAAVLLKARKRAQARVKERHFTS
eukprot:SAG31_NODE_862_length_11416_cov_8.600336_3_plen_158_part_00